MLPPKVKKLVFCTVICLAALLAIANGLFAGTSSLRANSVVPSTSSVKALTKTKSPVVLGASSATANRQARNVKFVDNVGGEINTVFVHENYAYLGTTNGFHLERKYVKFYF